MINKLLLIDDDELTSYLIKKLVKTVGGVKDIITRENGLEGLEYLSELMANREKFPEVIMLDIDMPVMNGFEFAEIYEKSYWHRYPDTKLMMITSSKRKHDFEKCLSYKCVSECVYKPLTSEKIELIVLDHLYRDHHQVKQA